MALYDSSIKVRSWNSQIFRPYKARFDLVWSNTGGEFQGCGLLRHTVAPLPASIRSSTVEWTKAKASLTLSYPNPIHNSLLLINQRSFQPLASLSFQTVFVPASLSISTCRTRSIEFLRAAASSSQPTTYTCPGRRHTRLGLQRLGPSQTTTFVPSFPGNVESNKTIAAFAADFAKHCPLQIHESNSATSYKPRTLSWPGVNCIR